MSDSMLSAAHRLAAPVRRWVGVRRFRYCALLIGSLIASNALAAEWQQSIRDAVLARDAGDTNVSIALLEQASQHAPDKASRVRALTELGLSLAQADRPTDADATLQTAYLEATADTRYPIALALGNVSLRAHVPLRAEHYYQEVIATSGDSDALNETKLTAELNLVGLRPERERLDRLEGLAPRVEGIRNISDRARSLFAIGAQASELLEVTQLTRSRDSARLLQLSYQSLHSSRELAQQCADRALLVDAGDALAQLYESQHRYSDAYQINQQAIDSAARLSAGQAQFSLVRLEWRAARLQRQLGNDTQALASYLRAVQHLDTIRLDLPIEDAHGKSTYQTLQRPIFAGLIDVLLTNMDALAADAQQTRLATAVTVIEQAHQAELQDYLGDRCSVDAARSGANDALRPGVAIVYPVILRNRLEVIVKTSTGLTHHTVRVSAATLGGEVQTFRGLILDSSSKDYLIPSRHLYDWIVAPIAGEWAHAGIHELVIVPDSFLRLVPFAALHDGEQFLAQRYSISTVTGLTMTESPASSRNRRPGDTLLIGLSAPGPVVERLVATGFTGDSSLPQSAKHKPTDAATTREMTLRQELALPGVKSEIETLQPLTHGIGLLDAQFTVERFAREVQSGQYSVVHIASHSFFGGSVADSYLLAYDNVIRIDQLQQLIAINDAQQTGIDLLTLSACDSATGDDRAPLGFAGAGVKARARSVLGSLWAVSDTATQRFMQLFYTNLAKDGKAEALTRAQRALIQSPQFSHPYYWAPFTLTGDWN